MPSAGRSTGYGWLPRTTPEQLIILGHGALRVPAAAFHAEVEQAAGQIAALLARQNRSAPSRAGPGRYGAGQTAGG